MRPAPTHWRTSSAYRHYVDCFYNDDTWEQVVCTTCGQRW